MKDKMKEILKQELCKLAKDTRKRQHFKQSEMGSALQISDSSYSNIETGESMCSTLTTVLLLTLQPDAREFIERVKERFDQVREDEKNE